MTSRRSLSLLAAMALPFVVACGSDEDGDRAGEVATSEGYTDVDVAQAKLMIDTMPELVVIDVSPYWGNGHLPRAQSLPLGSGALDQAIPMLDKSKPYLVYCHSDPPSMTGASKLVAAGIGEVYRLRGNYAAWVAAGYPVEM